MKFKGISIVEGPGTALVAIRSSNWPEKIAAAWKDQGVDMPPPPFPTTAIDYNSVVLGEHPDAVELSTMCDAGKLDTDTPEARGAVRDKLLALFGKPETADKDIAFAEPGDYPDMSDVIMPVREAFSVLRPKIVEALSSLDNLQFHAEGTDSRGTNDTYVTLNIEV